MFENVWLYIFVGLFIWYLSHQAGRLDRLHHRIDVAQAALDGHLTRRAGIAAELVALNFLDPASEAYLVQSAHDVLAGDDLPNPDRLLDENELTSSLCEALADSKIVNELRTDPAVDQLLMELAGVLNRIQLAKRFHTEAVQDCLVIREQLVVRLFRLAGRASAPRILEFDDRIPSGLTN